MQTIETRIATPGDAAGITLCFQDAYSGTYPLADFVDAARLEARLRAGGTVFAIAVEGGKVVAGVALERTGPRTGEFGHGVVLRSHRGHGLFTRLHEPLIERARELGLEVVYSHCVTSHVRSQSPMAGLGARVAGLTLAAAPSALRFAALRDRLAQRESFLDHAFVLRERKEARVHVPDELRARVAEAYRLLGLPCRFLRPRPEPADLRFTVERDAELGTATLRFAETGIARRKLDGELAALGRLGCLYARVPLASSGARAAILALRARGFSFAAVFPGLAEDGTDILVLQRPRDSMSESPIEIASAEGEAMKRLVFEDLLGAGKENV